jgi:hypothetical protein
MSRTSRACLSMTRHTAATSSLSEVSGHRAGMTDKPLAVSNGTKSDQQAASPNAPWTRTTLGRDLSKGVMAASVAVGKTG